MDMKTDIMIERVTLAVLTAVFTTLMLVAVFMLMTDESVEDSYTVTLEYDCRAVILKPSEFPTQVVDECRDKFRFMKESPKTTV